MAYEAYDHYHSVRQQKVNDAQEDCVKFFDVLEELKKYNSAYYKLKEENIELKKQIKTLTATPKEVACSTKST